MNLFKEYEKQRKYNKRFLRLMIFLFFFLPLVIYITGKTEAFYIGYVALVDMLIVVAIVLSKDKDALEFALSGGKITLILGLNKKKYIIICDKAVVIHTEGQKEDLQIIVITSQRQRNKFFKPVTKSFIKRYYEASREYLKAKSLNPELEYYYFIIKKGGFYKYELLDMLYKNCTYSKFTNSSIDSLKMIKY